MRADEQSLPVLHIQSRESGLNYEYLNTSFLFLSGNFSLPDNCLTEQDDTLALKSTRRRLKSLSNDTRTSRSVSLFDEINCVVYKAEACVVAVGIVLFASMCENRKIER